MIELYWIYWNATKRSMYMFLSSSIFTLSQMQRINNIDRLPFIGEEVLYADISAKCISAVDQVAYIFMKCLTFYLFT